MSVATPRSRRHASGLPRELAQSTFGVVRPQDARGVYAFPAEEFPRLVRRGLLHRLAHGYYAVVPAAARGREWLPSLEASAYGIAAATYGEGEVVLMGLSAARMHGALPRAVNAAIVAVPAQRPALRLADRRATIRFRRRRTHELDAERLQTDLGSALVTSREQTLLDLAKRPDAPALRDDTGAAILTLFRESDADRLQSLAHEQRLGAALRRAEAIRAGHA
jgi:predicted transcriptional regulator of viral defense system